VVKIIPLRSLRLGVKYMSRKDTENAKKKNMPFYHSSNFNLCVSVQSVVETIPLEGHRHDAYLSLSFRTGRTRGSFGCHLLLPARKEHRKGKAEDGIGFNDCARAEIN